MNIKIITKRPEEKNMSEVTKEYKKTIEDVSEFLNEDKIKCAKAIDLIVEGEPVFVFIPGDRELNMAKMISYLKVPEHEIEMADDETIEKYTQPGYTGPIGLENARIIIDKSLTQINNLVVGANKAGYHYINANYGRDFEGEIAEDLTLAKEGDQAYDGSGAYKAARGIEVGNIFQLGTKYSEALEANFLDQNGVSKPFIMGSYGIGISRSISAVVEQYHDDKGIIWPTSVAPFEVIITLIKPNDEEQANLAEKIYKELKAKKIDVLLDDRNERPGVKFNDRDLIGIPYRITVGKDAVNSIIEYSTRAEMENKNLDADEAIKLVCENIYKDLED